MADEQTPEQTPEAQAVRDAIEHLIAVETPATVVDATAAVLAEAEDGSSFLKERGQWRVVLVQRGHAQACAGATILEAVATIGAVRTVDSIGNAI